jgi:hypothetical protein
MADIQTVVNQSNIPAHQKSRISRWLDSVKGGGSSALARARGHVTEGAQAFRQGVESGAVGALLGAAHVELPTGLDIQAGKFKIPLDAVVGIAGLAGGVALAHDPHNLGSDLRNAGAAALSVFAFRESYRLLAAKKVAGGGHPGGDFSTSAVHGEVGFVDPIALAAQSLA